MRIRKTTSVSMRGITSTLVLLIFCLSPLTLFAQKLVITPADVMVEEGASAEFTVVLSLAPTGDVTVTIMFNDSYILSRRQLEFKSVGDAQRGVAASFGAELRALKSMKFAHLGAEDLQGSSHVLGRTFAANIPNESDSIP